MSGSHFLHLTLSISISSLHRRARAERVEAGGQRTGRGGRRRGGRRGEDPDSGVGQAGAQAGSDVIQSISGDARLCGVQREEQDGQRCRRRRVLRRAVVCAQGFVVPTQIRKYEI